MASRRRPDKAETTRRKPATTPEDREFELINLAQSLAEEQLRSGDASSQVVTHFLKLGSSREQLEQEKLRTENVLQQKKIEELERQVRIEALFEDAMAAFRGYQGEDPPEDEDPDIF